MVIWGGYLDEAGQSIWLKFQPPKPAPPDQDSASHIQGLRFEGRLFPGSYGSFTPQVSVVSFSTGDEFEAFTALVLVIVMAMQQKITRERRLQDSWPQNPIWLRNAVRWLRRVVRPDQRFSLSAALDKIILHLLFDAFGKLPDQPAAVRFIPSAADQMALLAGDWIGHQLFSSRSEFDAPLKNLDARRFVRQLRWLCEKCTKIAPKNAEHFYRLGAILCLQGEGERAYLAFKQAEILDVHAYRIDGTMAMVLGEIALQTSVSSSSENAEMAMARFAAHAARAMSSGSLYDITQLRETMVESDAIKLMTYAPERHRAAVTAINVVKRMLDDWAT
jgi:hypothetical protein